MAAVEKVEKSYLETAAVSESMKDPVHTASSDCNLCSCGGVYFTGRKLPWSRFGRLPGVELEDNVDVHIESKPS